MTKAQIKARIAELKLSGKDELDPIVEDGDFFGRPIPEKTLFRALSFHGGTIYKLYVRPPGVAEYLEAQVQRIAVEPGVALDILAPTGWIVGGVVSTPVGGGSRFALAFTEVKPS